MSTASSGAGANPILRIVDANLNRIGEGLRLLEEVARMVLNDSALTEQLKTMRHETLRADWPFHRRLLEARDAGGDVGAFTEVAGESQHRDLPLMVVANARRVQESLRLLEEVAKLPDAILELPSDRYKEARFALYTIEQKLLSRLHRRDKVKFISGLYIIIDTASLAGRSYIETARETIRLGAHTIRLDDRRTSKKDLLPVARGLSELCQETGTLFVIHDHLDLVVAADAGGLHIGRDSLPVEVARRLLPVDRVLGVSAESSAEAAAAEAAGADYVAVTVETLPEARKAVSLPVVCAVSRNGVAPVLSAGADSVAVVAGELPADIIEKLVHELESRVEAKRG